MTVTLTGDSNFDKFVQELIIKRLEDELRPTLPWLTAGNYRPAKFVKGSNNTMRFLRMADMAVSINGGTETPGSQPWLTEATAPTPEALTFGYEEFSAYQAGRTVQLSDKAMAEHPLDLLAIAAEKVALNADQTADAYVAWKANAGTNVMYAGTGNVARGDVGAGDVVTGSLLRRAARTMKQDLIPTFSDGSYRAIINPGVVFDIEEDSAVGGWLDAARYSGGEKLISGEMGKFAGIRFVESTNAQTFSGSGAGGVDIYSTYIFGPESYAFGDWGSISAHFVAPGASKDDALAQVATVGWKGWFGATLIDQTGPRYLRVESSSGL